MKKYFISFIIFILISFMISAQEQIRIAIIPFQAIGVSEIDSQVASALIETAIVNNPLYIVIEKNQAEEILDAQKFSLSGCVDESCAVELGKMLSAEQIILGSLSSVGGMFILNAKIVDVTTGKTISADKQSFSTITEIAEEADILALKLAGLISDQDIEEEKIRKEKIIQLTQRKGELELLLSQSERNNSRYLSNTLWSLAGGLLFSGLSVTSFFLAGESFIDYNAATTGTEAENLRQQTALLDTGGYISATLGLTGIGLSINALTKIDQPENKKEELYRVIMELEFLTSQN